MASKQSVITTQFRVPIDDSVVWRWQSKISPVADAFDDSEKIIVIIHQK